MKSGCRITKPEVIFENQSNASTNQNSKSYYNTRSSSVAVMWGIYINVAIYLFNCCQDFTLMYVDNHRLILLT